MAAVLKHEIHLMFSGFSAYVYGAFLTFAIAIYMMYYNLVIGYADFEYALAGASFAFIVIIPLITMRTFSEEKKQKTDQLLYSLPITSFDIVAGKFLAVLLTAVLPLCITVFYPFVLKNYGNVYLPAVFGTYLGFILLEAALVSIGIFISSLTESQAMAAGICFAAMIFNYYMVTLAQYAASSAYGSLVAILIAEFILAMLIRYMTGNDIIAFFAGLAAMLATSAVYILDSSLFDGLFPTLLENVSLYERFYQFVDGIFDYTYVIYFLSVIIFFLFLTTQSMEKRRYN